MVQHRGLTGGEREPACNLLAARLAIVLCLVQAEAVMLFIGLSASANNLPTVAFRSGRRAKFCRSRQPKGGYGGLHHRSKNNMGPCFWQAMDVGPLSVRRSATARKSG
jgi:hypothetical protein